MWKKADYNQALGKTERLGMTFKIVIRLHDANFRKVCFQTTVFTLHPEFFQIERKAQKV